MGRGRRECRSLWLGPAVEGEEQRRGQRLARSIDQHGRRPEASHADCGDVDTGRRDRLGARSQGTLDPRRGIVLCPPGSGSVDGERPPRSSEQVALRADDGSPDPAQADVDPERADRDAALPLVEIPRAHGYLLRPARHPCGRAAGSRAGPGEVVVRVRAAGICGGDLHEYRAGRQLYPIPYPRPAQGHELAGEVARGRPGRRRGFGRATVSGSAHGRLRRMRLVPSWPHGAMRSGSSIWASCAAAASPSSASRRPPTCSSSRTEVGFDEAALLDCTAVAVHAVHRVPIPAGARVTVLGTGAIGQAVAQVARASGAAE